MTGEELYELYKRATLAAQHCEIDAWGDLTGSDHDVWEALALATQPHSFEQACFMVREAGYYVA